MVDEIPEGILREMHNDMVDCATIASSAMTLAAQRSADLKIPVQITLTTLKVLIEINLERSMNDKVLPDKAHKLCEELNLDVSTASMIAHQELERLVRAWMAQAKYRDANIT